MNKMRKHLLLFSAAMLLIWGGCGEKVSDPVSPDDGSATTLQKENQGLQRALEASQRHAARLMEDRNIVGVGAGRDAEGNPTVQIYTRRGLGVGMLPALLDGVPVSEIVSGDIVAFQVKPSKKPTNPGGGKPGNTPSFDPQGYSDPIYMGVSSGWQGGICMTGTIGFRVTISGEQYVVSNNHVFADENQAQYSTIVQPGTYDNSCNLSTPYATLSGWVNIVFSTSASNYADVAWAKVDPNNGRVVEDGTPDPSMGGYGDPGHVPHPDAMDITNLNALGNLVDLPVQKYGRTTSHTKGVVTGIGTFNIGYSTGAARFVNQIVIQANRGKFSDSGDSGSLIVTDDSNKSPVGLLFAGSRKITLANPIGPVLDALGVGSID